MISDYDKLHKTQYLEEYCLLGCDIM